MKSNWLCFGQPMTDEVPRVTRVSRLPTFRPPAIQRHQAPDPVQSPRFDDRRGRFMSLLSKFTLLLNQL